MLGFCRPAPGRAVSSCTLPAVRVPRISSRVFLVLPVLFLPSGFHGSSPGSSWVFLYSSCRQGSTDLPRVSLCVPVLFLPSGFHGSPPGSPRVCLCFPCRRVPRDSTRFGWVSISCHDGSRDLPQVCSSLPQLLWTSGIHMTLPQVSSGLPVSSVSLSLRSPCVSVYLSL